MSNPVYLVSHGSAGDFGPFRSADPLECGRGDRVVVRTPRGLELGEVLCQAGSRRDEVFPPELAPGDLLRRATAEDEGQGDRMRQRAEALFADARRLAA